MRNVKCDFSDVPWQGGIKFRQVCHCLWHFHMCLYVSVFGFEEGDCRNLDSKQTDILSSHNKWSGVSTNNYCQRQLGKGLSD